MRQYMRMSRRFFALALLASFAAQTLAQQAHVVEGSSAAAVLPIPENFVVDGIPPVPMSLVDNVKRYTEFRSGSFQSWDPQSRRMLIETRFADAPQVHLVAFPGGDRRQLTFFSEPVSGARFNPKNSNQFLFSKDIGGNEFFQLYTYDLSNGNTRMLTDGKSRNTDPLWSHQGNKIIFNSTQRNGADDDFFITSPDGGERMLAQVKGGGWNALDWSPDDRYVVVINGISANESYLYLLDVNTGKMRPLTPRMANSEHVAYGGAKFSRDGKGLYITTDHGSEFSRLAYMDLSGAAHDEVVLTQDIPWDVDEFDVSKDGKWVAFTTNEDGVAILNLLNTGTRRHEKVSAVPVGEISRLQWHPNSQELGFTLSSARSPADAYSYNIANHKLERWTFSESGGLNPETFSEPKLIKWKSFDGTMISGFLYMPPRSFTGPRPVIVNVHGGPESQSRPGFNGRGNYLMSELGCVVIQPNVRGSTGYGKTFLAMDNGIKREGAYEDMNALFDWIKTQPGLDGNRILVTGGSYGGHMTLIAATRYSDKIAGAVDVVGPSNFVTFLEHTSPYRRDLRRVEYGDERDPKVREFLLRTAPMSHTADVHKPLLVVAGYNDPRVPYTESEQIANAVKQNGVPVWFLMAKDEGHGFAKKKNADFQFYVTAMFIQKYLLQ